MRCYCEHLQRKRNTHGIGNATLERPRRWSQIRPLGAIVLLWGAINPNSSFGYQTASNMPCADEIFLLWGTFDVVVYPLLGLSLLPMAVWWFASGNCFLASPTSLVAIPFLFTHDMDLGNRSTFWVDCSCFDWCIVSVQEQSHCVWRLLCGLYMVDIFLPARRREVSLMQEPFVVPVAFPDVWVYRL